MDVEVRITGLAELEARLLELDALAGERMMRRILRWTAMPLEDRAKANAYSVSKHGSSGALSRSIGIVSRKPTGAQVARVSVTSRTKDRTANYLHNAFYSRQRKGIFYGWLVEKGHRVGTRKTGYLRKWGRSSGGHASNTGKVPGQPWFYPALASVQSRMATDFEKYLRQAVRRMEARAKSKDANPDALVPDR